MVICRKPTREGLRYGIHDMGDWLCSAAASASAGAETPAGAPAALQLLMLTVFHGWYQAHAALADGILFAMVGIVALS